MKLYRSKILFTTFFSVKPTDKNNVCETTIFWNRLNVTKFGKQQQNEALRLLEIGYMCKIEIYKKGTF